MMREYDAATLRKLQKLELEVLKDIDKMCRELDIHYFAIAGIALGAKRHKGFIPWDDDIDIGMMRDDINKLLKYVKENYDDKYIINNNDKYFDYPYVTTQLALKTTSFVPEILKDTKIPLGIGVDIFPFDNIPDNDFLMAFYGKRVCVLSKIIALRQMSNPPIAINGINVTGWKRKIIHAITFMMHKLLKLVPISNRKIYLRICKLSSKYNMKKTKRIGHPAALTYDYTMDYSDVFPVQSCKFEDTEIMVPNALEKHLEKLYGDYMQPPPVEKRQNHFPFKLDFGIYADENRN